MFEMTYLHIGLDKTGSSSIQLACHENRATLAKLSVFYPDGLWHAQLGSCFCENPKTYYFNLAQGKNRKTLPEIRADDAAYLVDLNQQIERTDARTMVLSYEGFPDLDAIALARMRAYLDGISGKTRVIMYCRDPISYAESAISQRAKSGEPLWDVPPVQFFADICEKFSSVFGAENLVVREYSSVALRSGDVRQDFFEQIGFAAADMEKLALSDSGSNPSLTAEAILIGEALRKLGGFASTQDFSLRYTDLLLKIRGEKYHLTMEQINQIVDASSEHVRYLRDRFRIDFSTNNQAAHPEYSVAFGSQSIGSIAEILQALTEERSVVSGDYTEKALRERTILSQDLAVNTARINGVSRIRRNDLITFDVDFQVTRHLQELEMGIHIFDERHRWVFGTNSRLLEQTHTSIACGAYCVSHYLVANLSAGKYSVGFAFSELQPEGNRELAWHGRLCDFEVYEDEPTTSVGYAKLPAEISLRPIHRPPSNDAAPT